VLAYFSFFFSSRRRHTRFSRDWSSDVCSSDLRKYGPWLLQWYPTFVNNAGIPGISYFPGQFFRDRDKPFPPTGNHRHSLFLKIRSEERRVGKECSPSEWSWDEVEQRRRTHGRA